MDDTKPIFLGLTKYVIIIYTIGFIMGFIAGILAMYIYLIR
jgi:hypothetical protein